MRKRRGFTLLELMLVLAVLVVIAAMTMPALGRVVETQRLKQGADQVRAAWMRTHLTAMRTGKLQMFCFENGAGRYRIETWYAAEEEVEAADATEDTGRRATPAKAPTADAEKGEQMLPDDVVFSAGDAESDNRGSKIEDDVSMTSGGAWSRPILFYPDGSTSNAHLVVSNKRGRAIRVDLRGLTGGVTVGEIERIDELAEVVK